MAFITTYRELHVCLCGISSAEDGAIKIRIEAAVYRSDGAPVIDGFTVTIQVRDQGAYKTSEQVDAAVLAAAVAALADPDGWNIPAVYDAKYLYGSARNVT
jgi:hypothetical protein